MPAPALRPPSSSSAAFDPVNPLNQRTSGRCVTSSASTPAAVAASAARCLLILKLIRSILSKPHQPVTKPATPPSLSAACAHPNPLSWTMSVKLADSPKAERDQQETLLNRRSFLRGAGLVAAGMALYSGEIARHEISIPALTIPIRNLPPAFEGFRIAQVSDLHYDEYTEPWFVHRVIDHVNALAPDLVLLTGDYISFAPLPKSFVLGAMHRCAQTLAAIACPQRFAVMGNHDSFLGAPTISPILAAVDIPLLVNQHVPIERAGQRLWLAGIHDPVSNIPDLDAAIPAQPDGPVLLMSHGPDYADTVAAHPRGPLVDLMLSGHSHGGQIRLPFVGALHTPDGGQKYVEGLFQIGGMQLYVNRGIGTVGLPLRLNCPPEITLFTLTRSQA